MQTPSQPTEVFDADYYLNGPATGKSNYTNYSWMPERTMPFCAALKRWMGMLGGDTFMDFGCARGYVVRGMRALGVDAKGVDISQWAIDNSDIDVAMHVRQGSKMWTPTKFCLAKDVLEHMEEEQAIEAIQDIASNSMRSLIIVPLESMLHPGVYVRAEDDADPSHKICKTLGDWGHLVSMALLKVAGSDRLAVTYSYRIPGLKPGAEVAYSTGFIEIIDPMVLGS